MVNEWIVTLSFNIHFHIHLFRRASSSVQPRASYISHLSSESESLWCWYWSHRNNHILLSFLAAVQYTAFLMSGGILQYKHNWWCTESDYDIPYIIIRMFNKCACSVHILVLRHTVRTTSSKKLAIIQIYTCLAFHHIYFHTLLLP